MFKFLYQKFFNIKSNIDKNDINAIRKYYSSNINKIDNIIYTESWFDDETCYTALTYAIRKHRYNIAKCLIEEFNANILQNNKNENIFDIFKYNNAVIESIKKCKNANNIYSKNTAEHLNFFKYLINKIDIYNLKIEISLENNNLIDYYNILHTAIEFNSYIIAKYLIEDLHFNIDDLTPICNISAVKIAVLNKNLNIVELLDNNYAKAITDKNMLRIAFDNKHYAMVEYLKASGCKIL